MEDRVVERTLDLLGAPRPRGLVEGIDGLHDLQSLFAGDRWSDLHVGAGLCGGADELGEAAASLWILEPLSLRLLGVLAAVPFQRLFFDGREPQPTVLAPDLDVRLVALIKVVA